MNNVDTLPREAASLLNPAFCGEIIRKFVASYEKEKQQGLPYSLAFLILPIILHRKTRELITLRMRQQLHVWMQNNQIVRFDFAQRTKVLVPLTKETILFLLQKNAMIIDENGCLSARKVKSAKVRENEEIEACYQRAEKMGVLFARAGTETTIYTMWGVCP